MFSEFLKKFRKNHKLTQKEVANKLNTCQANYNKYENDERVVKTTRFINIFIASFNDILTEEELAILNKIKDTIYENRKKRNVNEKFIKIIKEVRLRNKISLKKMGNTLGLSSTYINNAELGMYNFSNQSILKFYINYHQLLTEEENKEMYDHLVKNNLLSNSNIKNLNIDNNLLTTVNISNTKLEKQSNQVVDYQKSKIKVLS